MNIWNNSVMTTVFYSGDPSSDDPCTVKIDGKNITIEYEEDGEIVHYLGIRKGTGHFELKGVGFTAHASLHAFKDSSILEGSWVEGNEKGMWKIALG